MITSMITIKIKTDNEAFKGRGRTEVARILKELADSLKRAGLSHGYSKTKTVTPRVLFPIKILICSLEQGKTT